MNTCCPKEVLATCWKDGCVDDELALGLLKVMTEQQSNIFQAIGVDFASWDGRPLTIKDLAHCLGQYSNYVKLQSDMKRKVGGTGRLLQSKSYLDVSKACRFCDTQTDEGLFCDACLCFYCKTCEAESCAASPECWTCTPCKEFTQLQLVD